MEETTINAIQTFGFPAVMCFYLLTRTTKAIDNNTAALKVLTKQINRIKPTKDNEE